VFITEHDFELPKGYVDADGTLHRHGIMRLATAADEILPMRDPRVTSFPAYLIVVLLARVVLRLGTVPQVNAGVIEGLFAEDLSYLQQLYNEINGLTARRIPVCCPACAHDFQVELPLAGGSWATP
jgi:hypothetical protein